MYKYRNGFAATLLFLSIPLSVSSQEVPPSPAQDTGQVQTAPAYAQEQLDQMLAPVALYPDPLIAQILMAATYPLEVVQADRWLQNPQNAGLSGNQLADALQQQPWDPSVKSLVPFPQVLQTMDKNLQWTEQLGDAFLTQQSAVMDTVQQLRKQAQMAGHLDSGPQQVVSDDGQDITIQPAIPDTVYVPYYDPAQAYGAWPYPGYPPYYFPAPADYAYDNGLFDFGVGFAIIAPFWGWNHWDWHNHRIDINNDRFRGINNGRNSIASGVWQHNPEHRGGVPYQSAATRAQFQRGAEDSRRNYRGYSAEAAPQAVRMSAGTESSHGVLISHGMQSRENISGGRAAESFSHSPQVEEHRSAPVFESFSNGNVASAYSQRGAMSRSAPVSFGGGGMHGGGGGGAHSGGGHGGGSHR